MSLRVSKVCLFATILLIGFIASGCDLDSRGGDNSSPIIPTTTVIPLPVDSSTPQRVADLTEIVIALEKYKRDNRSYPITFNTAEEWDRFVSASGDVNEKWISGLVPKYIDALPRDPRMNNNVKHQYAYRSNGANYKLLAVYPDDCKEVAKRYPELVDPKRSCTAYGFWTRNAAHW